jgi:hypothetical protein
MANGLALVILSIIDIKNEMREEGDVEEEGE